MDDVRGGEGSGKNALSAGRRILGSHHIGPRSKDDRSSTGGIEMRRHCNEGVRVVGSSIALGAEHFRRDLRSRSGPLGGERKGGRAGGNQELASGGRHRWTFNGSM